MQTTVLWSLVLVPSKDSSGKKVFVSTLACASCLGTVLPLRFVAIISRVTVPLVGPVSSMEMSGKSQIAGEISRLFKSPPMIM